MEMMHDDSATAAERLQVSLRHRSQPHREADNACWAACDHVL